MSYPGYNVSIHDFGLYEVMGNGNPRASVGLRHKSGEWLIAPDMGFSSLTHLDGGCIIAHRIERDGYGAMLIDIHGNLISERYNDITPTANDCYIVGKGAKQNIMRRNGSLVLKEWPHWVSEVREGYFHFSKTVRKTKTTPTRYMVGVAHVDGIIVFPMIFDSVLYANEHSEDAYITIKKDGQSFGSYMGCLIDPLKSHYPKDNTKKSLGEMMQKMTDWILSDLHFFYYDTDAEIDVESLYPVGKVLRTGDYVSVSDALQYPTGQIRFLIATSHAALLYPAENPEERDNKYKNEFREQFGPRAIEWKQAVLSPNAWLKVMDVYRVESQTQVLLLQIPESLTHSNEDSDVLVGFINEMADDDHTLIESARMDFITKLFSPTSSISTNPEWIEMTSSAIGYDKNGHPNPIAPDFSLNPIPEWLYPKKIFGKYYEKMRDINGWIHYLAKDRDIARSHDGFEWRGIIGSVCDGCMYAAGTCGRPEGCGRLFKKSFQKNYLEGICKFWKYSLEDRSEFEELAAFHREKEHEFKVKTSGSYALSLVKDFIAECLDNDIDNLRDFDFSIIADTGEYEKKYGPLHGPKMPENYAVVKALMELIFGDVWPELNVHTLDQYIYQIGRMIHYQRLTGSRIAERRFMGTRYFVLSDEMVDIGEELHSKLFTIGDFIVWPNKVVMADAFDNSDMRGYIDRMFIAMHDSMCGGATRMNGALNANRHLMKDYQGKDGFAAFMRNSLLTDFLDESGVPMLLFAGVSIAAKNFNHSIHLNAMRQYRDFMIPMIERRATLMIEILKRKLESIS